MNSTLVQSSSAPFLDIHVLNYSGVSKNELKTCLSSLSNSDVTVRVVDNDSGSMETGRTYGFSTASPEAKYVSFVDADDYVRKPLAKMISVLTSSSPKALFTNSVIVEANKPNRPWNTPGMPYSRDREFMGGPTPHQLMVFDHQYLNAMLARVYSRTALQGKLTWTIDRAIARETSQDQGWSYHQELIYLWNASKPGSGGFKDPANNLFVHQFYERLRYA